MFVCRLGDRLFGSGQHLVYFILSELLCNFPEGNFELVAVPVLFASLAVLAEDADNLIGVIKFSERA